MNYITFSYWFIYLMIFGYLYFSPGRKTADAFTQNLFYVILISVFLILVLLTFVTYCQ